jgi:alkylation response protein AidB-like acyl-CoA dehydrogenase
MPPPTRDLRGLARELRPLVEAEAAAAEQAFTLSPALVDAFARSGLFHLMVPRAFGGDEADPGTILDVFAELAWADGSVGWSLMANASSTAYVAFLHPAAGAEMVRDKPYGCSAGMYAPLGGQAHREGTRFRVSGHYQFGSGCAHATYFGSGAFEYQHGAMAPPDPTTGFPAMLCYYVPRDRVEIRGNWDTLGLRGTGSFDYHVPEQFVDEGWTFPLLSATVRTGGPLFHLGPIALAGLGHAGWAIGLGARALDEIETLVKGGRMRLGQTMLKDQQVFQRELGAQRQAMRAATLLAHDSFGRAFDFVAKGSPLTKEVLDDTRAATSWVTHVAEDAVLFAYRNAGSTGLRNPSRIQACLRDMLTGGRHVFVDDKNLEDAAQARLA